MMSLKNISVLLAQQLHPPAIQTFWLQGAANQKKASLKRGGREEDSVWTKGPHDKLSLLNWWRINGLMEARNKHMQVFIWA